MPPPQQRRPQLEKTRSTRSISLIGEWCPEEEGLDSSTRSSSSSGRRYSVEIPSSSHLQQTYHRQASLPHPCNNRRPVLSSTLSSSARRSDHLRRQLSNDTQNNTTRQKTEEPIFYSINTMLHRQEDECWDNNNNVDSSDRSSNSRRLLVRKDSQSSTKTYRHSNSSSRRLLSSTNHPSTTTTTTTSASRRRKSVSFPPTHEQLITAIHIIPRLSNTEIQRLYYTNDEILHMKKIYQKREYKKKMERGIKQLSSKMKQKMNGINLRNVDDDLSVECIVNAGENLVSSPSSGREYHNAKRSSGSTKMGGVIERASSTLPSMITLLL